jgi:hypothetical protein
MLFKIECHQDKYLFLKFIINAVRANFPEGKGWSAHKAYNLTTICEPTV